MSEAATSAEVRTIDREELAEKTRRGDKFRLVMALTSGLFEPSTSRDRSTCNRLRRGLLGAVEHPLHAELVDQRTEIVSPEHDLQRYFNLAALTQSLE